MSQYVEDPRDDWDFVQTRMFDSTKRQVLKNALESGEYIPEFSAFLIARDYLLARRNKNLRGEFIMSFVKFLKDEDLWTNPEIKEVAQMIVDKYNAL